MNAMPGRVVIDPDAWIVTDDDIDRETRGSLIDAIGSTGSGTGAAVMRRVDRRCSGPFAKDVPELRPYMSYTTELMVDALNNNSRIVVEGTQGFGLSLLHSRVYPHCTSRDTTAGAFVSEAGLSPIDIDEIVLVVRAFPIRVAGNSGPLPSETTWDSVTRESGCGQRRIEYTSVTRKVRRVARFDKEVVKRAIAHNRPTTIVMNHLDYVDAECALTGRATQRVVQFLRNVESQIGVSVDLLGFGPDSLMPTEATRPTAVVA
jgi:adenylosuccinate synthase